jgi:hypothetical protein
VLAGCGQRRSKLWAAIERVCAFARFDLDKLINNVEALDLGKACKRCPLSFEAEAITASYPGSIRKIGQGHPRPWAEGALRSR